MPPKPFRNLSNWADAGETITPSNATMRITLNIVLGEHFEHQFAKKERSD